MLQQVKMIFNLVKEKTRKYNWKWISFVSILIIVFIFLECKNVNKYYYDSIYYSGIAETIVGDGETHDEAYYNMGGTGTLKINLMNYPETFRGYIWPTVIGLTRGACILLFKDGYIGWRIIASFMMAIILALALPTVFGRRISTIGQWARLLICLVFVLIYWGDFISYPLSDMAAFGFMCCACALQRYALECQNMALLKKVLTEMLVGFFFYAAYNTRISYLYSILVAIIVFGICVFKKKQKETITLALAIIIGATIIALPQMAINNKYTHKFTPRVITEQYNGYERGLELSQIYWGISQSRYETCLADESEYPSAKINFCDPIGKEILERENISEDDFNVKTYIKLIFKYPLDFCGIYARHIISVLTPTFQDVYIRDVSINKGWFSSIAIMMWVVAIGLMIDAVKNRNGLKSLTTYICFAIAIASAAQCLGSVEIRFIVGIYMMMYYYLFCVADYNVIARCVRDKRIDILLVCVMIFVLWITVWGSTLAQNEMYTMLIHDATGGMF